MTNERLRNQLALKGMTSIALAEVLEVDPKTTDRWLATGRIPRNPHRALAAEALDVEETYLWPALLDDARARDASQAELRAIYPHRGAVPPDLWNRLVNEAIERIEILVYSGLFLVDSHPDLAPRLVERAEEGLQARLLYGDPDAGIVADRGIEEGIGDNLAARIRLSLTYMKPVLGVPGLELRQHRTVLYNSIFRFDSEMLVNTHAAGSGAPLNPVLHLQRIPGGHLFDHYLRSFEYVWESAKPLAS